MTSYVQEFQLFFVYAVPKLCLFIFISDLAWNEPLSFLSAATNVDLCHYLFKTDKLGVPF